MTKPKAQFPRIALRGFKPGVPGVGTVLGGLETAVMELLWAQPAQAVTEVEGHLRRSRSIAHTTVLTTLDRLHRKGYLVRSKRGKAFVYAPRLSRDEFERGMAEEVIGALLGHFSAPALSAFVDLVGEDPSALERLEAIIRQKRKERGQK
jgi:predicted transcriptional regulator